MTEPCLCGSAAEGKAEHLRECVDFHATRQLALPARDKCKICAWYSDGHLHAEHETALEPRTNACYKDGHLHTKHETALEPRTNAWYKDGHLHTKHGTALEHHAECYKYHYDRRQVPPVDSPCAICEWFSYGNGEPPAEARMKLAVVVMKRIIADQQPSALESLLYAALLGTVCELGFRLLS